MINLSCCTNGMMFILKGRGQTYNIYTHNLICITYITCVRACVRACVRTYIHTYNERKTSGIQY